jgi:hypothetical protein
MCAELANFNTSQNGRADSLFNFDFIISSLINIVIDSKDHSKSLILIKHYETESTEPIKFKPSSPKLELRKLSQNFKRNNMKQL